MLQHGCLIHLRAFLRHALLPFSEELLPEVPNPQVADRDGGADDDDPRNAHPPRDDVDGLAGQVEEAHLEEEERAGDAPDDGVDEVEGRRQRPVHPRRGGLLGAPDPGERPDVLEEAGDLGEDEEDEERVGAVADEVAAGDEHEERGDVVGDEEGVPGEEGEVVEQVHGEVGDAVVEDVVLEAGVGRGAHGRRRHRHDMHPIQSKNQPPHEFLDQEDVTRSMELASSNSKAHCFFFFFFLLPPSRFPTIAGLELELRLIGLGFFRRRSKAKRVYARGASCSATAKQQRRLLNSSLPFATLSYPSI